MSQLDCLFLHVPRWDGSRREIMVMPMGVPAMANLLADDGRATAIVHLGIERENPRFSLKRMLLGLRPRAVMMPLHWNQQTRSVIDVANRIRRWLPETAIVLGGLTASAFATEAVRSLPFLTGVVRGDGEEPARALMRVLADGEGTLDDVPNLVWRGSDGRVRENTNRWAITEAYSAQLRHGSLGLLRNRDVYLRQALYADFSEGAEGSEGYAQALYLNAGRGCTRNCAYCGGAAKAQAITCGRDGLVLYPTKKLVADTLEAVAEGAGVLRTCFDPPGSRARISEWFAGLRAEGLRLRTLYDFWYLPPRRFLDDIAQTFTPGSVAVYSPECGSERVRFKVRAYPFTNQRLLTAIHEAEDRGLAVHCFFSAGLPTETPDDIEETARLIDRIREETNAAVSVTPMFADPASPLAQDPDAWGVELVRRNLRDFYEGRGIPMGPGYTTEYFDEQGIMDACSRLLERAGLPPLNP